MSTLDLDDLERLAKALPDALRFDCVSTMDNGRAMLHALGTQTTHAVASTHAAAYAIQDALRLAFAAPALVARVRELEAVARDAASVLDECIDGERRAARMYAGGAVPARAEDVLDDLRALVPTTLPTHRTEGM